MNVGAEDTTSKTKIVVFTGDPAYSVRKGIVEIDRTIPGLSWLILVHSPEKSPGRLWKSQWKNLRRNGWRWIPYEAGDLWQRLFTHRAKSLLGTRFPGKEFSVRAIEARPNMRWIRVADIHAPESLAMVKSFAPDLGLSIASPILRRSLFSLPRLGTFNLHKGRLPDYRGMPPAFWELWNDEKSVGCTVHRVDDKLDSGDILRQTVLDRAAYSTVRGLQLQLDEIGAGLMREAVQAVLAGTAESHAQAPRGKTYRKPTLAQVANLRRRLQRALPKRSSFAKRALSQTGSMLGLGLGDVGLLRLLPPRITVLLYHRVSDDARDNLTVGVEQFDRHMEMLQARCQPISIEQVLASGPIPRSHRPLVAVTFDDGYLDNYLNAAPLLMRHSIPAAFFVSTGIVGANGRFPHDVRRGNPHIPVMSWDHLRTMRDWGFTVGSHTVSHIDCAAEPEERVLAELAQSRDQLKAELGVTEPVFAYPYGGRRNMTPERLDLVQDAGYIGCLSAYGGTNVGTVDPYNVLRRGIHWEFSDTAFLFQCSGLK